LSNTGSLRKESMLIWCKQVVFKEVVKDMIFDD